MEIQPVNTRKTEKEVSLSSSTKISSLVFWCVRALARVYNPDQSISLTVKVAPHHHRTSAFTWGLSLMAQHHLLM